MITDNFFVLTAFAIAHAMKCNILGKIINYMCLMQHFPQMLSPYFFCIPFSALYAVANGGGFVYLCLLMIFAHLLKRKGNPD